MINNSIRLLIIFNVFLLCACEEEYFPSGDIYEKQLVVEAIVELGNETVPPYCILTRSFPYDTSLSANLINGLYVREASVYLVSSKKRVKLQEFCLNDLQEPFRSELIKQFGYDPDSVKTDFCAFLDVGREMELLPKETYQLEVSTQGDTFISSGIMPEFSPIDSFWFVKPPGRNNNDTFAQLKCIIRDNPLINDYYRYFTAGQDEQLIPNINSVTDDVFFNGKTFEFSLSKALSPDDDFDDNAGLFRRGDTITVKWCNIPKDHFEFWNALEAGRTRQGPFSAYVRIPGNVSRALGLFGLQHCTTYHMVVPKN